LSTKRWGRAKNKISTVAFVILTYHSHLATFYVDSIEDIVWSKAAFSSLMLSGDHKEIFLALVESQLKNADRFDDVIAGKGEYSYELNWASLRRYVVILLTLTYSEGKGVIFLLAGPPGVGKTLTAESS
jgi:SpoVK/Ycf46/Vps4 family AAA+-type ATPase